MLFSRDLPMIGADSDIVSGVRVLVFTPTEDCPLVDYIAAMGAKVEVEVELYSAISAILDDPQGYRIFVMDCGGANWQSYAARAVRALQAEQVRVRIILCNADCATAEFPNDLELPICLGRDCNDVTLSLAFRHVLRDRLAWAQLAPFSVV